MDGLIRRLIDKYGSPVVLRNGAQECTIRALLQPVRHRGERSGLWDWSTLGGQEPGQFLLLSAQCPDGFDLVEQDGARYWLRRWERYAVGGEVLYYWAVLTKEE